VGREKNVSGPFLTRGVSQSGTVIKFDNVVTSQHGVNLELGEFSERVPSLRQFFGCVRAIYPGLQVVNIREQRISSLYEDGGRWLTTYRDITSEFEESV